MFKHKQKRHRIFIVEDALRIATEEAIAWKHKRKEAGGSLVGIQNDSASFILYALPTGPNADQSGCHIATDVEYQNRWLKFIFGYFERINVPLQYLADYHSHPMYLRNLSGTDRSACAEILSDTLHGDLLGMPLILITFTSGQEPLYVPFWITLHNGRMIIEDAVMDIMTPTDPQVRQLLQGQAYVPFQEFVRMAEKGAYRQRQMAATSTANTLTAGDLLTHRLQLEMDEVSRIYDVDTVLQRSLRGHLCLSCDLGQIQVVTAIPGEFPLNPPTMFIRRQDSALFEEFTPRRVWNSLARIADIIDEIQEQQLLNKASENQDKEKIRA